VNCSSILITTPNTRSFEFAKMFILIRLENTTNPEAIKLLKEVLENPNLTDKKIIAYLKQRRPNQRETIEKVNDIYYDDEIDYDKAIAKNKRYVNQLNPKHGEKIEDEKKKNIELNLRQNNLKEILSKEKRMHIVLDNYSVHHAHLIKSIAEILNINLIYLPTSFPELNPIEDVWRVIKKAVSKEFIESKKHLEELYTSIFYEEVDNETFYNEWLEEFIVM